MTQKKKSFEEDLAELEQIVNNLENGDVQLEEALAQFQKGVLLSNELQQKLTNAEATVTKLMDKDGNMTPLDVSEQTDDAE